MNNKSDPYYIAVACAEQGFPVRPNGSNLTLSSDPVDTHNRWAYEFSGCPVELPTGSVSGVLAISIRRKAKERLLDALVDAKCRLSKWGISPSKIFFYDRSTITFLYECHDEVIIDGTVELAQDFVVLGNGASIILPPYECPISHTTVYWSFGNALTRDALPKIGKRAMEVMVHIMNVTETFQYHVRDAA